LLIDFNNLILVCKNDLAFPAYEEPVLCTYNVLTGVADQMPYFVEEPFDPKKMCCHILKSARSEKLLM